MNRKQFAVIAVFTAMETYFFNEATMAGQMLFCMLLGPLDLAQSPDGLYGGEDC